MGASSPSRSVQRLAVFGAFSDHDYYQRNRILVALMGDLAAATVVLRPPTESDDHSFSQGQGLLRRLGRMTSDLFSLARQRSRLDGCDTIFVPYPAYLEILLLWILGALRGRRLVVDAFLELHSTVVEDRGQLRAGSLGARLLLAFQRFTLGRAQWVLIDTASQAALLERCLEGTNARVVAVPVGIDEHIWQALPEPAAPRKEGLEVLFWGTFIPLHGVATILAAAALLEERGAAIRFQLVGDGQTAAAAAEQLRRQPLENLQWQRELLPSSQVYDRARNAQVVLGVFGASAKAGAVVPYKVQQALAMNLPVVTRTGEHLFADDEAGLVTVAPDDPEALAEALEQLAQRYHRGWKPQTRAIYDAHFSNACIREQLASVLAP